MTEKVGVIWFICKDGVLDKEFELIASDFFKNNVDVKGGKFHSLESIERGKILIDRFEKALKIQNELILKK